MKRALSSSARVASGGGTLGVEVDLLRRLSDAAAAVAPSLEVREMAARMVIVAMFTFMAVRLGADFAQTGRLTSLLLVAGEALVVVLTVFRRPTGIVDLSVRARGLTTMSLVGPMLAAPAASAVFLPEITTATFSACGLLVVIAGKLSLGRSFGLMPANRGVVSSGLYRLVRHPIYMGYLITHIGFLAANGTVWNIVAFVCADLALLARAVCEERILARDPAYRAYQQTVRWRVVPGLF